MGRCFGALQMSRMLSAADLHRLLDAAYTSLDPPDGLLHRTIWKKEGTFKEYLVDDWINHLSIKLLLKPDRMRARNLVFLESMESMSDERFARSLHQQYRGPSNCSGLGHIFYLTQFLKFTFEKHLHMTYTHLFYIRNCKTIWALYIMRHNWPKAQV